MNICPRRVGPKVSWGQDDPEKRKWSSVRRYLRNIHSFRFERKSFKKDALPPSPLQTIVMRLICKILDGNWKSNSTFLGDRLELDQDASWDTWGHLDCSRWGKVFHPRLSLAPQHLQRFALWGSRSHLLRQQTQRRRWCRIARLWVSLDFFSQEPSRSYLDLHW